MISERQRLGDQIVVRDRAQHTHMQRGNDVKRKQAALTLSPPSLVSRQASSDTDIHRRDG
jgi:hypothetical protein